MNEEAKSAMERKPLLVDDEMFVPVPVPTLGQDGILRMGTIEYGKMSAQQVRAFYENLITEGKLRVVEDVEPTPHGSKDDGQGDTIYAKEFLLCNFLDRSGMPVHRHPFISVRDNIRLYYEVEAYGDGTGFYFWALENTGGYYADSDKWDPHGTFVDCMYTGSCAFDGIRHMYMGDKQTDDFGYHFYPNVSDHIAILTVIEELEKTYCREKREGYGK